MSKGDRFVVVLNLDKTISCFPILTSLKEIEKKYKILTTVNKPWNPYFVGRAKAYFKQGD